MSRSLFRLGSAMLFLAVVAVAEPRDALAEDFVGIDCEVVCALGAMLDCAPEHEGDPAYCLAWYAGCVSSCTLF